MTTAVTSKLTALVSAVLDNMVGLAKAGLTTLWIGGKPVPAGRPRVTRWGTYYPKSYTQWQKQAWNAVASLDAVPSDRPIALMVGVHCLRPKKTEHVAPMGDVDNFAKGPMDLLTKRVAGRQAGGLPHDLQDVGR